MRFTLGREQQDTVNASVPFYRNSYEQVMQIAGLAGTGKSVVLNAIAERLNIRKEEIAAMAFIGQAAIIMRLKGFRNAKTIHSWLFKPTDEQIVDMHGNPIYDTYHNRPKIQLGFEPKALEGIRLMIIDEGGTVPRSMKKEIESRGIKIIVAGDLGQLPPVDDEPAYLYEGKIHYITEVMRQKAGSNILYLAHRARLGLPIQYGYYGDCLVIDEDDLTDQMLLGSDIIICGKNKTRDVINKRVRRLLGFNTDLPMQGERMVCRKNNWNIEVDGINLANGLIGTVLNSPGIDGFDGTSYKINFRPNMLHSPFIDLRCDYNYLIAPYEQKAFLKNNKYAKGLEKLEFAYAITCHLSQGGTYHSGIYIEEYLSKEIQNNLNYTGITRFANGLIYVKRKRKFY